MNIRNKNFTHEDLAEVMQELDEIRAANSKALSSYQAAKLSDMNYRTIRIAEDLLYMLSKYAK